MNNPFKKIIDKAHAAILHRTDSRILRLVAEVKDPTKKTSDQLYEPLLAPQSKTLEDWKLALVTAQDPDVPNRWHLRKLYENLRLDNHLSSVIDSRILFCQRSTFKIVDKDGNENEELTKLFERTWFEELIRLIIMSRFEGTKLIELFDVNSEGELDCVDEIPLGHFNPKKGVITRNPGDDKGWSYKEGGLENFYLQVGKDKDLGMLADIAPIVLAKKMGMGSLLDFVDKYGVPPLFITTDREDDGRLEQLWEAAKNFKSNHYMVGRGNEKFETGNVNNTNANNVFFPLFDFANKEISKRILGGTGLTDEKGFVGSVEIQYKLALDRFESDKLMCTNIINKGLFPRLIKLSPVYKDLATHSFKWENVEVKSSKDWAEIINTLGNQFIIDPEFAEQETGVKILGQKTGFATPPDLSLIDTTAIEAAKKKTLN